MSSRTKVRPQTPRVATASVPTKARKPRRVSIPSAAQDTAPSHAAPARAATGGRERDVTEGVPDGEELAESSAWIRAIYDGFPEHLGLLTPDGTLLDANRAVFDFHGGTPEEVVGLRFWETGWFQRTPGAPEALRQAIARAAAGESVRFEAPLVTPSGETKWFDASFRPIRDDKGQVAFIVPAALDITERKRREGHLAFLADIQTLFASLTTPADIMRVATDRIVKQLDLAHCAVLEIDEGTTTAKMLHVHSEAEAHGVGGVYRMAEFHSQLAQTLLEAGRGVVIDDVCRDPRSAARAAEFAALGIGALANVSQVTSERRAFVLSALRAEPCSWTPADTELLTELAARIHMRFEAVRAETALSESEERLRLALDAARMGSWDWHLPTGEIVWTPHHEIIFGYEPGKPRRTYADFHDRLHVDDATRVEAAVRDSRETRTDYSCEFRVVWPDGSIHWVSAFGRFHFDAAGRPIRMVGTIMETTERKRLEAALRTMNDTLEQRVAERTVESDQRADQVHALATELTQVEQRERRRLAQILHDDLQQVLVAARMKVETARSRLADGADRDLTGTLTELEALLLQCGAECRSLSHQISPRALYRLRIRDRLALAHQGTAGTLRPGGRPDRRPVFRVGRRSLARGSVRGRSRTALQHRQACWRQAGRCQFDFDLGREPSGDCTRRGTRFRSGGSGERFRQGPWTFGDPRSAATLQWEGGRDDRSAPGHPDLSDRPVLHSWAAQSRRH